jgi:tetratricopeptide (TPR) repeat protein
VTLRDDTGPLDLDRHSPDEYEGKSVFVNGTAYRVAGFVGQGADKIVHRLVNVRSGLTYHVIKVYRDQALADRYIDERRAGYAQSKQYFAESVPDYIVMYAHNGWFELQDSVGLLRIDDPNPETGEEFDAARAAAERQDADAALAHLDDVLRINPFHTQALVESSEILIEQGNPVEALARYYRALSIEPNFCGFYKSLMQLTYQLGMPFLTLDAEREMKRHFPYQEEMAEITAAALLACGEPQEAIDVLTSCRRKDIDQELASKVRAAATALLDARRRAQNHWATAGEAVVANQPEEAAQALRAALGENPGDPWLLANKALLAARAGLAGAEGELARAMAALRVEYHPACMASLAYHAQLTAPGTRSALDALSAPAEPPSGFVGQRSGPIPAPALLWLDLDGALCLPMAAVADILVPAALVAHAATSDPAYRTVAELYMPWSSS